MILKSKEIEIRNGKIVDVRPAVKGIKIISEAGEWYFERGYATAGFCDSHFHLPWLGDKLTGLDLSKAGGFGDLLSKALAHKSDAEWLVGRGWIEESWSAEDMPSLNQLDAAFPARPVLFIRKDEHSALINSAGMERCGISIASDFAEVFLPRLTTGAPAGIVCDDALSYVYSKLPPESETEFHNKIKAAEREIVKYGITEIHEMKLEIPQIPMYMNSAEYGSLSGLKVTAYLVATAEEIRSRRIVPFTDGNFSLRGIKFFLDGSFGSASAAMKNPFESGQNGLLTWESREKFKELIVESVSRALQPAVHAIGDNAVKELLEVYREVYDEIPKLPALPFRIEHAQSTDAADLGLFMGFPLVASLQPIHAISDEAMCRRLLGAERLGEAYRMRSIAERVQKIIGGSDAPIESHSPFDGIAAFVRRDWNTDELIDRKTAIEAFTANPRIASGTDKLRGRIKIGAEADIAIIDNNILNCPPVEIQNTSVLATFTNGKAVYLAD